MAAPASDALITGELEARGEESAGLAATASALSAVVKSASTARGRVRRMAVAPEIKVLLGVLRDALVAGERVALPGLGTFFVVIRPARVGRNPRTGERIALPARARIRFKAGAALRARCNDAPRPRAGEADR